jgi:hypothetical protein
MTITRYSMKNIILLVAAGLVSLFNTFLVSMTAGFATDPVHDFRSGAQVCFLYLAILALPIYLLMFRWCSVGAIAMWSVTIVCFLVSLFSGLLLRLGGGVILLLLDALICWAIYTDSEEWARKRAAIETNGSPNP